MHLTEAELCSETVYRGGLLQVRRDTVQLPNGNAATREYVVHSGAVLVVPLLDNGNLLFERQYRYPLRQAFIEFPAGKIDPNEDPLQTGRRELQEEAGYSATEWRYLAALHPCIGYSNEIIHLFLATGLVAGEHQRDDDEGLELFEMPFATALRRMQQGEITDAKTMVALFWAEKVLSKQWA